jgi:hypothetical protein
MASPKTQYIPNIARQPDAKERQMEVSGDMQLMRGQNMCIRFFMGILYFSYTVKIAVESIRPLTSPNVEAIC